MQDYDRVRAFMASVWPERTYGEELSLCKIIQRDEPVRAATAAVIDALGLRDRKMSGYSIQGITLKTEGKTHVSFSAAFHTCVEGYLSPVSYLAENVRACRRIGLSDEETARQCGRALRAFPSFVREMDLERGLASVLEQRGVNFETRSGVDLDMSRHTDVLLRVAFAETGEGRLDGKAPGCGRPDERCSGEDRLHEERPTWTEYHLWSYLPTRRGKSNLVEKLAGRRRGGPVGAGVHLLCPFPLDEERKEDVGGWFLHPASYFARLADTVCRHGEAVACGAADGSISVSLQDVLASPEKHLDDIRLFAV